MTVTGVEYPPFVIKSDSGAQPVPAPMVQVGTALAGGPIHSMMTSAVAGAKNKVWASVQCDCPIIAWSPKNTAFADQVAFVGQAARLAEERSWRLSRIQEAEVTAELRLQGVQVEPLSVEFDQTSKHMGERLAIEWLRTVGNDANQIFIPCYATR